MPIPKGEFDGNEPVTFGKSGQDDEHKSAFTEFTEKIAEVEKPLAPPAEKEGTKPTAQGEDTEQEDKTIPYARFQKTNRKLAKALEELEDLKAQGPVKTEVKKIVSEVPDFWKKLYGDNEASKEGYEVWAKAENEREQTYIDKTLKTLQQQQLQETQAVLKEEENIDNEFESFEETNGSLSDKDKTEILGIIDEFTPKDEEGNYLGATIPIEKAYEILEMKRAIPSPATQQRKTLAGITGGGGVGKSNQSQPFRPGDWGGWRRVVGR